MAMPATKLGPAKEATASISPSNGMGVQPVAQSSAKTWEPAGSGSRPGPSRYPIPTSAAKDPHGLDGRKTPSALT
jgi:hypothetical protein